MTRPHAFVLPAFLLSALLLAACQPAAPAGDAPAAAAAAPAAGSASPSAEAEAAAASAAAAAGAQPAAEATGAAEAEAAPAPAETAAQPAPGPVAGVDYVEIPGGQPYEPLNGKIEVVEVFNYICPACARLEPTLSAWAANLPGDVRMTYVPAPWGPQWVPYARAYYVADALGLEAKTHAAVFHAIHIAQTLPGEGKQPDEAKVAAFYGQHGADARSFLADMHSFATDAKLKRGLQFMTRSEVGGTPTIVVDGKYRVLGKSYADMLRITDALVARERAARDGAAR